MTTVSAAWVGWTTDAAKARADQFVERYGMSTTGLNLVMDNPPAYASRLHHGVPGQRAACGVRIPEHREDVADPCLWWAEGDGIDKCRRCLATMNPGGLTR